MRRNLKALGLALVAVFALSAVAASAALAVPKFTSSTDWTVLSASAKNSQVFEDEANGVSLNCTSVGGSGSMSTDQTTVTFTPTYGVTTDTTGASNCKGTIAGFTVDLQVHMNGCDYLFTAAAGDGTVKVECPVGKQIEITCDILGAWRQCIDIAAQTPTVPTVDFTNGTKVEAGKTVWDVTLKSTATGVTYTKTGLAGSGTFHSAKYTGEVTVTAKDTAGVPASITFDPS
jgi:hypothetical protein